MGENEGINERVCGHEGVCRMVLLMRIDGRPSVPTYTWPPRKKIMAAISLAFLKSRLSRAEAAAASLVAKDLRTRPS